MAEWLKQGAEPSSVADQDRKVVEATLHEIETRGDAAVRELSIKFDGWDRDDYRLMQAEVDDCLLQLLPQDIADIKFAQEQRGRRMNWSGRATRYGPGAAPAPRSSST